MSIVALRSPFGPEKQSSLVARLSDDAPITVDARDIDFVVTEYGVASIRGVAPAKRAAALIGIAHPDHRDSLRQQWVEDAL